MEDYRLNQTGQEVQDILNGAAMQTELAAENERATSAEQTLQGNIDAEELARQNADAALEQYVDGKVSDEELARQQADTALQGNIDGEETRAKAAEQANATTIETINGKIPAEASAENKLVDNASLQGGYYTKAVIDNLIQGLGQNDVIVGTLPASGVANTIYRVPGDGVYSDYMWYDGAWQLLATYSANIQGYQYIGIATPTTNPGTPSNNVFYFAHEAGTYTNFGALAVTQGINILKFDGTSWALEQLVGIDAVPTAGSVKIVQSGGVFNAIAEAGVVNISEVNKVGTTLAKYSSLSDALAAVPSAYHRGGMSIKFIQLTPATYSVVKTEGLTEQPTGTEVQEALAVSTGSYTAEQLSGITLPSAVGGSVTYWLAVTADEVTTYTTWVITYVQSSDNKYVQFRYMSTSTANANFIKVDNWQGVDDKPTPGSKNFVESGGILSNGITGFPLVSIASGLSGANITDAGQYYFNTTQKKVKYCKVFVDATHGTYIDIDPIDGALYTVGEKIFIYDATEEEMKYAPISKIADEVMMIEGKGFEQAEYILIKDASSSTVVDDADGTRLRVVFSLENAGCIRLLSSYRYLINIYNTLAGAIEASSSPKETITGASSYSWSTGLIEHDFVSNSGFLSISFRKDDDSIITVEDKAAILDSTELNIYRHIKEVDILKKTVSVVERIQNTQYHIEQTEFNDYVINISENISKLIVGSNVSSIQGIHVIGKNLVDQSTIKAKKIINDSGVEVTDNSSSYYDCTIPCHGKTIKSNYTMQRIYMYDSNMQFLGRESASNVRYLYVVPENVWFIKIQIKSVSNISDYCAIFDNGIDVVSYSPFREYSDISNDETCNIYTSGIVQTEVEANVVCKALIPAIKEYPYWEPSEVTNDYNCTPLGQYTQSIPSLNTLGYRGFLQTYYDVYLGDYADGYSVTKEELGMDSGAVVEHAANPIFSYTFAPKYYNKTVLLSAGMNTCEASTFFGLAYFIKALMEHTETGMLALYNTTRFVVIPVICPTGISHDPLLYRNANDVRINKNFSYLDSWKYNYDKGGQYPGAYPDSEVETKILKEWLNRYAGSTFYMDCHSDTGGSAEQHLSLTVCFCSDSDTVDKLQYRKSEVEQFYRDKGYIQVGETPTMTYRAVVNDYPKTPYSYYICRTPALMHEQYCHSTMYGSDGDTNNDSYGIKHYCALIRWYVLIMCKSNVEIVL